MNTEEQALETKRGRGDDYIVIPKSWVVTAGVALATFLLGGAAGYFLALGASSADASQEPVAQASPQLQQVVPTAPPARLDSVSVDDDPYLGPEDAPVTIVEFSDFHCPYCKRFHDETFPALMEQYGDQIRFVYRDFPVVGGEAAARAAQCANEQDGFWEYHDRLFADPQSFTDVDAFVGLAGELEMDTDQFRTCVESDEYGDEVTGDYEDGVAYGVTGTPTFFINGVRVVGAQPLATFQSVIDEELGQ